MKLFTKIYFYLLLAVILLEVSSLKVFAQDEIEFEHISRTQGLPSTKVTSIVQDKYGMMWFGTFNGLVRFDGYNYKIFTHDPTDSSSLSDNFVRSLHLTANGDLLVATENHGFAIFDYKSERFTRFMHKENKGSLSNNNIISVLTDSKGKIWIGTWDGLNCYDPYKKKFQFFRIRSNVIYDHEQDFISSICEIHGILYLFTTGSRIIKFNPKSGTYDFLRVPNLPRPKLRLNRGGILYKDNFGFLWIGTELDGLYRMDLKTGEVRNYNAQNCKLTSNILMSIFQDSKGRLWVATDGGGIFLYDYYKDQFTNYHYDPNHSNSLSTNAVYTMYEDRDGNIWIGTYGSGLNVIKNKKRKFEHYTNKGTDGKKLSFKSVLSFAPGDSGHIWIGTDGGGLNLFDPKHKTFLHHTLDNSPICSNIIKSLLKDSEGNLWIGTYGNGLCRLDKDSLHFTRFSPFDTSLRISHLNVWSLQEDKYKHIWIGMLDAGLEKYNVKNGTITTYNAKQGNKHGLTDGSIMCMLIDRKNNIWAGTEAGGLCFLDTSRTHFVNFSSKQPSNLPSDNVQCIYEDSQGGIWVGTKDGGLSLLEDFENRNFKNYTRADGLPSNSISGIVEDTHGNLWLSTDNGLSCLNRKTNQFRNYDISDGLQSPEFNISSTFRDSSGYLYFGGTDGFNRFHPDSLIYNNSKPNVYIAGINLFNKPLLPRKPFHDRVYFTKPVHLLDTLELMHSDYVFSIQFTCTDFTSPDKNQFAYKLEGFDDEWNYVDASKRQTTYTNLSPGTYIFHVKASNNDGVWNDEGAKLIIIIHPPWWKRWWFRLFVFVALSSALMLFYYLRLNRIRKQNLVLTKLVRQKTSELQGVNAKLREQNEEIKSSNEQLEKQQFEILQQRDELEEINLQLNQLNATKDKLFSIIGHDLRNPVSALTSLTQMLQQSYHVLGEKDRIHIVDHIQVSSTTLKLLVNNLLDWALVQGKHLNTRPEPVEIKKVAEECFKVLKLHADGKTIRLENLVTEKHIAFADPDMLKTIVRNLVSNGIKFTPRGGVISVKTRVIDASNELEIAIADNGAGMDEATKTKLLSQEKVVSTKGTSNEHGSGLGLVIVKEFIEANKGRLNIESEIGKGTTFLVYVPQFTGAE